MQLQAIADVARLVTMATRDNISKAQSHCVYHSSEVLSENVDPSLRNMKLKNLCTFTVTMATAAILKKVNIPKALPHGDCHYCEVSLLKVQPSLRKMKLKKCKQFCGYHGNGSHFEIFQHWIHTGLCLLSFL
jgi:hypothetical protein